MVRPISRETIIDRRQPLMRWGAVFAGTALAVGLWILLQTLGMGLGLAAVDTDDAGSLKAVGIGTGIWSVIAPLIALFIGAYVAGRLAGAREVRVGGTHGAVGWSLATVIGLWAMVSIVSTLASGAARIGGAAAHVTGTAISGATRAGGGVGAAMSALGIDPNDLLGPINQRLSQQGKPPITADQLQKTLQDVAQRGLHEGQLDREVIVESVARNTALSRADAEDVASQIETRYRDIANRAGERVQEVGEQATHVALETADKTGKALLLGGVMMLLSLASATGGGMLGARSTARRIRRDEIAREEVIARTTIIPPRAEP
jgi:hypothetical protein